MHRHPYAAMQPPMLGRATSSAHGAPAAIDVGIPTTVPPRPGRCPANGSQPYACSIDGAPRPTFGTLGGLSGKAFMGDVWAPMPNLVLLLSMPGRPPFFSLAGPGGERGPLPVECRRGLPGIARHPAPACTPTAGKPLSRLACAARTKISLHQQGHGRLAAGRECGVRRY